SCSSTLHLSYCYAHLPHLLSFPTRRSSDLATRTSLRRHYPHQVQGVRLGRLSQQRLPRTFTRSYDHKNRSQSRERVIGYSLLVRSEEHTSELQSHLNLVCRLLLEKKKEKEI